MPLPEINLSHYTRASIRLNESTAEQVDQYAAFVHASAERGRQAAQLCLLERPRLPGLSEDDTGPACCGDVACPQSFEQGRERRAGTAGKEAYSGGGVRGLQRGRRGRDRAFNTVLGQERCCAPEESWTRHPQFGNCRALASAEMFTCVNAFRESSFAFRSGFRVWSRLRP